jgi:hypothetical protein
MSDFGNEDDNEYYKEKKVYLEGLEINPINNLSYKLVEEFRNVYENKLKNDDRFIYLFSTLCSAIDYRHISFDKSRSIIKEYVDKGKLSKSNIIKFKTIEEGGWVGGEIKKNVEYKEGNIMKACSDLKNKDDKYEVETELNIKEGLDSKVKRALIKSIINELNNNFNDYEFFYEKKN